MDRLYKGVWEKVTEDGEFSKALFKFTCAYKTRRLIAGYHTPLLDKYVIFVYNKISFCWNIANDGIKHKFYLLKNYTENYIRSNRWQLLTGNMSKPNQKWEFQSDQFNDINLSAFYF